jgi:hypothetical protein
MGDRLEALRSKLPSEVLSLIRSYDSHPLSDLIREIEFEPLPGHVYAASGLRLKNCLVWRPLANELRRRLRHNRSLASHGGTWLPIFFDTQTWILSFPKWQFETLEDLDYLPLWVKEEYQLGVR